MNKRLFGVCALLVCIVIAVLAVLNPAVPEAKKIEELEYNWDICKQYSLPERLYVIDCGTFNSVEERHMAVSLQGVVAKKSPEIYIITNDADRKYLQEIEKTGIELIYTDMDGSPWTLQALLVEFRDSISENGFVLYRKSEKGEGLNVATNYASLYGWLPVPEGLETLATGVGLQLKEDLTDDEYNAEFQQSFFEKHREEFEYNAVISLKYEATGLRDLAIQQGFYIFYIDEDEDTDEFRGEVLDYAGDNTPVLGWAKHEVQFVSQASQNGNMVIPSDHSHNNSFLSSFNCEMPSQKHSEAKEYTDSTKHYCALVFSDGDNIQWIQNGYSEYYRKLALQNQFPVTWSFSPSMKEFSPLTAKTVYSAATENDYFIAGVSGVGYMHPAEYPSDALETFTDITALMMSESDMHYISILDSTPDNALDEMKLEKSIEYYARYDNIKGGVLSLDPDRYAGGEGKIYFINDKPFITNRFSLWHPDGEGTEITNEWLQEQADIINGYPADIDSIDGYSVINIHPWTISVENLQYFVSLLDDDIELVTLDELLTTAEANIPHKNAEPKK